MYIKFVLLCIFVNVNILKCENETISKTAIINDTISRTTVINDTISSKTSDNNAISSRTSDNDTISSKTSDNDTISSRMFDNDTISNRALINDDAVEFNETRLILKVDYDEQIKEEGNVSRRLTSSRYAYISDYPYVVSVQKHTREQKVPHPYQHWCAGAILTPRVVITSADCVLNIHKINGPMINDLSIKVRAGSGHPLHGGVLAGVQEIAKHPDWGVLKSPRHNLALLVLDTHLHFSDNMHSVELPKINQNPPFNDSWVVGWGVKWWHGKWYSSHQQLQVYRAELADRRQCAKYTNYTGVSIEDHYMCLSQKFHRAPCTRDVGAPAVSDGILWGIANWGARQPCGLPHYPAVFEYLGAASNHKWVMDMGKELTARALDAPRKGVEN